MTQRFTRKPLIGAIRGYALGGGAEMAMNLDIAVAGEGATFGFPEVKRGVVILAGGLERFVKLVGHQRGESRRDCETPQGSSSRRAASGVEAMDCWETAGEEAEIANGWIWRAEPDPLLK